MVHLCNMKMSSASTRHKSKGRHYDIDGFISQLLASRKFDQLAEKLAEKAANKIMHIDAAPAPVERATVGNETNNSTESTQEANKKQSNGKDVNKYERTQLDNVELRKDFTGKIDPQAVVNATISLSENLQLKYKYFKKNALEKKVKSNKDPLPKNVTKEELTKQNKTIGLKDHINKTQESIFNQSATDKNQMQAKKESIAENKGSQDDTKNDDPIEDSNRNSEINDSCHSGTDGETNDSSKKPDHSLEGHGPGHEQTVFREAQHAARPQNKAIVEQEVSHVDNGIRKDKASSLEEDNQKHLTRSEENIIEKVEQNVEEPEKLTEDINKKENVIAQFRAHEDSFEENKVTSENPNGDIYRSKASDESDDRSAEERSPEDRSSKQQSAEDPNSSKLKPVIRKEGDKLYTYVRAPEYQDYHEKLAKWQKEHPDNPADFL